MIYIRSIFFILLAFALHIGCTALVHAGWPPQPLVLIVILAVWLERMILIRQVILPAAFLVDLMQPTHIPLVTIAILVAWFIAALVQRQWLTNHSLASLLGLSVLGIFSAAGITAFSLWFATSLGASATPFKDAWFTSGLLQNLGLEIVIAIFMGLLLRLLARFFQSRFLYASH